jgi:hypothetical protein
MSPIFEIADVAQIALETLSIPTQQGLYYCTKDLIPYNPLAYQRGMCLEIAPGEGISIYQSTAGQSADQRKLGIQIEWDEVDLT